MAAPSDSVTVLFLDLSDSTAMYAGRGDQAAFALISASLDAIEGALREAGGQVIKRLGDAVLAVAPAPDVGLRGVLLAIDALASKAPGFDVELPRVRAGVSHGRVVHSGGDVYGDIVNVAARLVGLAKPGEVLLTDAARDGLPADLQSDALPIAPLHLRGRPTQTAVFRYVPSRDDVTRAATRSGTSTAQRLVVNFVGRRFVVGGARHRLRIGRTDDNDIAVPEDVVSRHHASIDDSEGQFVLTDRSTNGTYVHFADGERLHVLRTHVTLAGSGAIFPGSERLAPIEFSLRRSSRRRRN